MIYNIIEAYSNWYKTMRNIYPNLYIVMISFLVSLWFQGMFRLVDKYFPSTQKTNILLMVVPVIIMYFGDGKLEEIYNFEGVQKRIAAINTVSQ